MPTCSVQPAVEFQRLGLREYREVWDEMRRFTAGRDTSTPDQIWLVQHPPLFTLGTNGKEHHILDPGEIPVLRSDRGGQVTYHGPGQLVAYLLLDLKRRCMGVRQLVEAMEQGIVDLLAEYGIAGERRGDAPGVYVSGAKIAALGLRVRRGCSYHGVSLNVDVDLRPFGRINPCGHEGMEVTSLRNLGIRLSCGELELPLLHHLMKNLSG
ncbi:MAG TPA: lipoyl(octanoyl) transferase LipB [Gammaproteobacteria bacterium]|nr:lipoyl(octanoyl) transferase LipB [Gammaproteobacteria bacterium]